MARNTYEIKVNGSDGNLSSRHASQAKAYARILDELLPNVDALGITSIVVYENGSLYEHVYPQR